MPFDALVMAAVTREIEEIIPARVDRVYASGGGQGQPSEVLLVLFRPGIRTQLLISMHPRFARIHLSFREHPPLAPPPLAPLLRKHLEGAHLVAARQEDRDRVLILTFRTPLGTSPRLVVEIMGPGSNLILLDGDGRILGAWREEGPRPGGQGRRLLLPGVPYESPPPPPAGAWGPFFAREMAARAGAPAPGGPAGMLPEGGEMGSMMRVADELWEEARSNPRPMVITDERGQPREYWCLMPLAHGPVGRQYPGMSQLLDEYHEEVVAREEFRAWHARLRRALGRQRDRQERLVQSLRADLDRAHQGLRYRTWGELLLAQASRLPAGRDRVEVIDYYREEPHPVEIPLDPARSARENAQEYFRRYTKARRSLEPLKHRLDEETTRLVYLEQLEEGLGRAADRDTLEVLEREMEAAGIPAGPGTGRAGAKRPREISIGRRYGAVPTARRREHGRTAGRRVLRFWLPGGEEVTVGRGAEANDFVTFVLARPDDIWLHARGIPGSHVILRSAPGRAASPEAIARAAAVAAHFSDARRSAKADVDWTLRKHVRRRPGGGPGQVLYREEHTLLVEPAPPPRPEPDQPGG
ncbi:MAG: NFACT RNA binding domain-containing protein [Bacillota bacterium]